MTNEELLKVSDMSEEEFYEWLCCNYEPYKLGISPFPENAVGIRKSLADLAFRLSGGKIAGKKPIEYIIDALIKKLDE